MAKFLYANMKSVPESSAPITQNDIKHFFVVITQGGSNAGNVLKLGSDNRTIIGGVLIIPNKGSYSAIAAAMDDEGASMLMGSTESAIDYPSVQDGRYLTFFPQDYRMQQWVTYLGPGARYPALSKGF